MSLENFKTCASHQNIALFNEQAKLRLMCDCTQCFLLNLPETGTLKGSIGTVTTPEMKFFIEDTEGVIGHAGKNWTIDEAKGADWSTTTTIEDPEKDRT